MNTYSCCIGNERGVVMVAAVLILAVLTIIGVVAINTSTMERQTSFNFMVHERAFYAAEAGMEHVKEALRNSLRQPARLALVAINWQSRLDLCSKWSSRRYGHNLCWRAEMDHQSTIRQISVYHYHLGQQRWGLTTRLQMQMDLFGCVRKLLDLAMHACSIEALLDANAITDPVTGYNAQEGSGSGKTYTSTDSHAVDFGTGFGQQVHING